MTWHRGELACFDTESTGVDLENDRIVSVTVAHIQPGTETAVASHLIAVDVEIPAKATEVHGITTEHAREHGKPAAEVLEAVAAHLAELMANGTPIIGMNCAFDFTLLDRELRRNGLRTLEDRIGRDIGPIVDVFVLDKAVDRFRKGGRKLVDMCACYGVRLDGAHDATEDALGAARVAFKMMQRAGLDVDSVRNLYGDRPGQAPHIAAAFVMLGQMSLAELHAAQVRWYAEQSEGLVQFWRKKANQLEFDAGRATDEAERTTGLADAKELRRRADDVTTDWPVRPWTGA